MYLIYQSFVNMKIIKREPVLTEVGTANFSFQTKNLA